MKIKIVTILIVIVPFVVVVAFLYRRTSHITETNYKPQQNNQIVAQEHLPCEFVRDRQILNTPCWTLKLNLFVEGLEKPVYVTHAKDGSNRLFVVLKTGVIQVVKYRDIIRSPFLDVQDRVNSSGHEQGLLNIVFHPDYQKNGFFYVSYTDAMNNMNVSRFTVRPDNPDAADPQSEKNILVITKKTDDHNGGQLAFGLDGYLYIGVGDDANIQNAQNKNTLTGKILRIDVNSNSPYQIPDDNPFINTRYRPEIYALGLRNPWSFAIDSTSKQMYLADVGEKRYEEVNIVNILDLKNSNFGWPYFEGNHETQELYKKNIEKKIWFDPKNLPSQEGVNFVMPFLDYHHVKKNEKGEFIDTDEDDGKACSGAIIGGNIYRGNDNPQLKGFYFFADYCTGTIRVVFPFKEKYESVIVSSNTNQITSFGADENGELYVVSGKGDIYKLEAVNNSN